MDGWCEVGFDPFVERLHRSWYSLSSSASFHPLPLSTRFYGRPSGRVYSSDLIHDPYLLYTGFIDAYCEFPINARESQVAPRGSKNFSISIFCSSRFPEAVGVKNL